MSYIAHALMDDLIIRPWRRSALLMLAGLRLKRNLYCSISPSLSISLHLVRKGGRTNSSTLLSLVSLIPTDHWSRNGKVTEAESRPDPRRTITLPLIGRLHHLYVPPHPPLFICLFSREGSQKAGDPARRTLGL